MAAPRQWTEREIERLRTVNGSISSNVLAREFRCCRWTVLPKERDLAILRTKLEPSGRDRITRPEPYPIPPFPRDQHPLPAGHPETWGLLTRGTVLDGTPWPDQEVSL